MEKKRCNDRSDKNNREREECARIDWKRAEPKSGIWHANKIGVSGAKFSWLAAKRATVSAIPALSRSVSSKR
jgi:ribosomal protein L37AE/L43A